MTAQHDQPTGRRCVFHDAGTGQRCTAPATELLCSDHEDTLDEAPAEGATVEVRPDGDVQVLDGELVDEPDGRVPLLIGRRLPRPATYLITALPARATVGRAPRAIARTGYVAGQGVASWAKRAGGAATHRTLREEIRGARIAGDRAMVHALTKELREQRDARHELVRELPQTLLGAVKGFGVLACGILGLLVLIGIGAELTPGGMDFASWWASLGDIAVTAGDVLAWLVTVASWAVVPTLLWAAWKEGTRVAEPPRWLVPTDQRRTVEVTPSSVVTALRDLGIPVLARQIKAMDDGAAAMLGPLRTAGCGMEVDVLLPSGVSTSEVRAKRQRLAENLRRHEHELHILPAEAARTVRLWVADPGALDEPVGPSPLVLDEHLVADYYTGRAPWGQDLRGDPVTISLHQRHLLITGLSNQGKTAAIRALALWLALDVTTELRIADLKGIGDWHMLGPVATVLIEGPADEHVIAATEMLEAGVAEMERRLQALDPGEYPNGVTRKLARTPGSGFHPLILIVDEAQVAFMCPEKDEQGRPYGGTKATSRFFRAARTIENQGRAVNVLLWFGTQDPTDQNLPALIREAFHIRVSLVVGTESQARMALGGAAVDGGAAPHELRRDRDKGVVVAHGGIELAAGQTAKTIRTHFIDGEAAGEVAKRAIALRTKRARKAPAADLEAEPDHLEAILAVLGDEPRMLTTHVIAGLLDRDPDTYETWTHGTLKAVLEDAGAGIGKSQGRKVVRAEDVRNALLRGPGDPT